MNNIFVINESFKEKIYEFVERKGVGHPDSLADALAEKLSSEYSMYTLKRYGAILHHNFDKVGLLGGSSSVCFGKGYMTKPIRVLLNGRLSTKFGKEKIPFKNLLTKWVEEFFSEKLPIINIKKDLEIHFNLSNQSSPGKTNEIESEKGTRKYWFEPRNLNDLQELKKLLANDTSLGVGYAPYSDLEKLILEIESKLNSNQYKTTNGWIGSDIKILGFRFEDDFYITMCIPQIANFVKNIDKYKKNLEKSKKDIYKISKKYPIKNFGLYINTRDNYNTCELYLTAIGSSIESGDEGLVGRGNRINGVISPDKPLNIEAACGKNPVYHIGKIYSLIANEIAKKIYKKFKIYNKIYLASQSGRNLLDPWFIVIVVPSKFSKKNEVKQFVLKELSQIPSLTTKIIKNKFILY